MSTHGALETGVPRAPHRFLQVRFADVLLRETQRIAHALRLTADGRRDRDDLRFDVLEGLEFGDALERHSEIARQRALVERERSETRARACNLERVPHTG